LNLPFFHTYLGGPEQSSVVSYHSAISPPGEVNAVEHAHVDVVRQPVAKMG